MWRTHLDRGCSAQTVLLRVRSHEHGRDRHGRMAPRYQARVSPLARCWHMAELV